MLLGGEKYLAEYPKRQERIIIKYMIRVPYSNPSMPFMFSVPDQDFTELTPIEEIQSMVTDEIDKIVSTIEAKGVRAEVITIDKPEDQEFPSWLHIGWVGQDEDILLILHSNDAQPEMIEGDNIKEFWKEHQSQN